jgi:hypothetical protein
MPLAEEPLESDPLVAERFRSMDDLKRRLIELGPNPDTYDRVFDLVGPDDEDEAKDALARFFEGSPTALCFMYKLLVKEGKANAIDEDLVAEIQGMHPDLNPEDNGQEEETAAVAPEGELGAVPQTPLASSDKTEKTAEPMFSDEYIKEAAKEGLFIKTASGFTGGPGNANYVMHGEDQTRICPKVRDLVSTHICRYHCLDGMTIDDAETVCGEAIWRQSVADKFSRDYKDEDGKWRDGYIRGRFHTEQSTEGNDYQLKPGQRGRPIKENAWSTEKRLQEMLKAERDERGYTDTNSPDHDEVYNFDQHELHEGPDNVQLDAKERDAIAKNASAGREVKTADSMFGVFNPDDPHQPEEQPGFAEYEEEEERLREEEESTTYLHELGMDLGGHKVQVYQSPRAPRDVRVYLSGSPLGEMDGGKFLPMQTANLSPSERRDIESAVNAFFESRRTSKARTFNLRRAKSGLDEKPEKKAFNLKRTKEAMGDVMSPPMTAGYVSSMCNTEGCPKKGSKTFEQGLDICPGCNQPLKHMTSGEVGRMSGTVTKASLDPMIIKSNGVYRASLGRFAAFGDSPEEAMRKLEEEIPEDVESQSDMISDEIQEMEEQESIDAAILDAKLEEDLAQQSEKDMLETEATGEALGLAPDKPISV